MLRDTDIVYGWFASWHMFWPTLLARRMSKPVVVVIGGYDVANRPDIGYGNERGGIKRWVGRRVMMNASALTTFSQFSQREAAINIGIAAERIKVIYLGVPDPDPDWNRDPRDGLALTVGNIDRENLERKGLMPFVQTAHLVPMMTFIVIGEWRDDKAVHQLQAVAASNVRLMGRVDGQTLRQTYRSASVYVQASKHEGFGLALAEAMLAGCVPVTTKAGALPEVVGSTGTYVTSSAPESVAAGILQARDADFSLRQNARDRILAEFPLERRRRELYDLVEELN
jgi:glycosyltransferase involved in cell wall biosynthesis